MSICTRCGSAYLGGAFGGMCPRCLMSAGPLQPTAELGAHQRDCAGASLPGHEVSNLLGRGGMASVYRARQKALDRDLAVKIVINDSLDPEFAERFAREAKVLAHLEHPNIVPIHEFGRSDAGHVFYTMKLVKGRTLQAILHDLSLQVPATVRDYSLDRLLTIYHKAGDAMAFAHSQGIIHRDLKPENIMVGEFGEVLLMDWGLAKHLSDKDDPFSGSPARNPAQAADFMMTLDGAVIGTPQFMSPEQAEGRIGDLDERSDIFSLGGVLYGILTLRAPVEGKTVEEILQKVRTGEITPPSSFGAPSSRKGRVTAKGEVLPAAKFRPLPHCPGGRVPAALSAVAMKALATKKEDRYQTVGALLADLEAYQSGFATKAEEAGAWRRTTLWVARHKTAAVAAALIIVVSLGFTARVVSEGRRAEAALSELRSQAPAFLGMARSYREQLDLNAALASIDSALKLDPTQASYHAFRGDLLQTLGRFAESRKAYDDAMALGWPIGRVFSSRQLSAEFVSRKGELTLNDLGRQHTLLMEQKRLAEAAVIAPRVQEKNQAVVDTTIARMRALMPNETEIHFRGAFLYAPTGQIELNLNNFAWELPTLEPFRGLSVRKLVVQRWRGADLSPLAGMKLEELEMPGSSVTGLGALEGAPLHRVDFSDTRLESLAGLRGAPLSELRIRNTQVKSLEPLRHAPLRLLDAALTPIEDLSPLAGKPLEELNITNTKVTDLSPIRGLPLRNLSAGFNPVIDFTPLRDLPLERLSLPWSLITDLEPLPLHTLRRLRLNATHVKDLGPLSRCDLEYLNICATDVQDFWVLGTLKLRGLDVESTAFSDGHIIEHLPLTVLLIHGCNRLTDVGFLDHIPTLRVLSISDRLVEKVRHLTHLRYLSTRIVSESEKVYDASSGIVEGVAPGMDTFEEFWQKWDAKMAARPK
jgi:serine/threonine protein kinase